MKKNLIFKTVFLFIDVILMFLAFFTAWSSRFHNEPSILELFKSFLKLSNIDNFYIFYNSLGQYKSILFLSVVTLLLLIFMLDLLHVPRTEKRINSSFWNYILYPQFILIVIIFIWIIFSNFDDISRLFLISFIFVQFLLLIISKKIRIEIFKYLRISGYDLIGLGVISNKDNLDKVSVWLNKKNKTGFYYKNLQLNQIYINSLEEAYNLIDVLHHGDYLILDSSVLAKKDILKITDSAENKGIHIYNIIDNQKNNLLYEDLNLIHIGPLKATKLRSLSVKNAFNVINKRIFDFIFSFLFICLIYWWVYILVFLIIKIQSKGPVIFKQERVGIDGEIFMCYKFRTMHIDSRNSKEVTKVGDERIFSFGKLMRKTNIDEFPQFINVFKGDMSVVGPRPHMVSEDKTLADKIDKYRMRRWVKPGITGYAAMAGYRGGTESLELMQKRINLDVEYIEKWNFLLDLSICFDTVVEIVLIKKKGH